VNISPQHSGHEWNEMATVLFKVHECHARQAGQPAAAENKRDAAGSAWNVVRVGLELTSAWIEVSDIASARKLMN